MISQVGLVPREARIVLNRELAELRGLSYPELVKRFGRRHVERRRVTEGVKDLEVEIGGELDSKDDPESGVQLWLSVRSAALAPIPVLRWLISARAATYIDEDGHDWGLGDPAEV